ncbi:virulence transcriptional regulator RovM [Yersinia intermedia]|jgi:DNA-binding transcriptional LysR family regulator|uniref:Transcriptional regulator LrhA n=1 Tax=Yersinia intermedia TaxID=631 RepID=A0A208ZJ30_YERIN|nr:virulence transcriptional regulator RovM [Yersinia intermedia]MCB5312035.1 virulence transcriptional regulator RovM [Yersinia intermedia]MCB5324678.1 virulence transcriptional regulator RovM [Yersinia intermedia]MCB5325240.1 virulence transcriptional regulator RovM [Yersinia intermedia]OVZ80393.1 transcriptional regulator LrhA [Yersinia intermedia]UNK24691.1 virulence transcriptional regulator RovM [Yersinia intermedia]
MTNANRPIINLDLDLLRTFVAVADLNTFASAAAAVCRTQSAVSQQMQRLEQLVGKELFARHGRNKLLTEHGLQLLGYARKILRFNDEACTSLMYSNIEGSLIIGASDDTADTLLPFLLNRVATLYPRLAIDVRVKRSPFIADMLSNGEVDLAITTAKVDTHHVILRTSPTLWYCSADYQYQSGESVPLVVMDEPSPFRDMAIENLTRAGIAWRIAYVASSLSAIRAAVRAGLGVTARPIEMMSPDLRVLGETEGLPRLPETHYALCKDSQCGNELALAIFDAMQTGHQHGLPSGSDLVLDSDYLIDEKS